MRLDSRLVTAAVLLALAGGCASGLRPVVGESVYELRGRHGVCAGASVVSNPPRRATLTGCLRIGVPGTRFDNDVPRLITTVRGDDDKAAEFTYWQVLVLQDGEEILDRALEPVHPHPRCRMFGAICERRVADVAAVPKRLAPGTYTIRYQLTSEDGHLARLAPVELSIVLR